MKRAVLFSLAMIGAATAALAQPLAPVELNLNGISTENGLEITRWKFHPGEDAAWIQPDFDDSSWETSPSRLSEDDNTFAGFLRARVSVGPELQNRPLSILMNCAGIFDVYLDGELIFRVGRRGGTIDDAVHYHTIPLVRPIVFDGTGEHVLVVHEYPLNPGKFDYGPPHVKGFSLWIAEPSNAVASLTTHLEHEAKARTFFATAAVTFALLHFLLFLFYRKHKSHLYYAAFTFGAAAIAILPLRFDGVERMGDVVPFFRAIAIAVVFTTVMGIRFLYNIFYEAQGLRMPRIFWVAAAYGIAVLVIFWNGPGSMIMSLCLVLFAEILRVLIVAIVRKRPYAWAVAIGVAAFILASAYQIVSQTQQLPTYPYIYLYGMLFMLIMMSTGLARAFARTNRDLEHQLVQVKDLSARAIEQERRASEQEKQRMRLEAENELKAKELAEARKRQTVLDELAATNAELRQTQVQLAQSEKMASLGTLVAGIAHEINTPVGAMSSMHDTLVRAVNKLKSLLKEISPEEYETNDKIKRAFKLIDDANEVIDSGNNRVTNIVRRLRSFARLDEAELKRADIHEGIEDTLTLVHHELKRSITVNKNFGELPTVTCFPGQLNQVFLNIIVNAKQAMPDGGEITITTGQEEGNVRITFSDTGEGIAQEKLQRIFDPGFTTKGVGVGTGLGLSICYQIMQTHRGSIDVESEVGTGTNFTIVFPMNLDKLLEQGQRAS